MIDSTIYESDKIILDSIESYIKRIYGNKMMTMNPQEQLMVNQHARDYLYSEDVVRFPRMAAYVLSHNIEEDTIAHGINLSISNLILDPVFIDTLMNYLARNNDAEENCVTGAYLTRLMSDWIKSNTVETKTTAKKKGEDATTESTAPDLEPIKHVKNAIWKLLGNIASMIQTRCANVDEFTAIALAADVAMNNASTISDIIASDQPVTADILDVVADPRNFIQAILLLEQKDLPAKPTANQTAFIESLKRWVYNKLDKIPSQAAYQMMVATYGLPSGVDVSTKFINPKSCGNQYPNLLAVSKIIINK